MGPAEKLLKASHIDVLKKIASGVILTSDDASVVAIGFATCEAIYEALAECGVGPDSPMDVEIQVRRNAKLEEWVAAFFFTPVVKKMLMLIPLCWYVGKTLVCLA